MEICGGKAQLTLRTRFTYRVCGNQDAKDIEAQKLGLHMKGSF